MSDIKNDYFEEGKNLARDRRDQIAAITVDSILGAQGKILVEKLDDLKNRGIDFNHAEPTLERKEDGRKGQVIIELTYSSGNLEKGTNTGRITIDHESISLVDTGDAIGRIKVILFSNTPKWGYAMAIEVASRAIGYYGVDREPQPKAPPVPEVTG